MSTTTDRTGSDVVNGSAMAAILAAGIGTFAMGFFVIANEAGLYAAPALYSPAGGVSGRTTFATLTWLVAWFVMHRRWSRREVAAPRVFAITLVLIAVGIVLTFPPLWRLVG